MNSNCLTRKIIFKYLKNQLHVPKNSKHLSLLESISYQDATPSLAQAIKMRQFSKEGKLTEEVIESIMCEEKPNQREKISFRADRLRQFIPDSVSPKETEEYVLKALEYYQRYRERQRQQER